MEVWVVEVEPSNDAIGVRRWVFFRQAEAEKRLAEVKQRYKTKVRCWNMMTKEKLA
jgi:hypothetical protein